MVRTQAIKDTSAKPSAVTFSVGRRSRRLGRYTAGEEDILLSIFTMLCCEEDVSGKNSECMM